MFEHCPINFKDYDDLESVTSSDGSRKYVTPDGIEYPSVTTVLSILSKEFIDKWKRRVGIEEANKISYAASYRGTQVHEIIEKYLDNDVNYTKGYFPNIISSLSSVKPTLDRIGSIYEQECALYSNHLKLAGRVDCVAEFDGKLSIIDFKTSKKLKKKEWISSYFMQCAAYAIMWEERTNIPIVQLVIIIAVDDNTPQVFKEHRDNWTTNLKDTIYKYNNSL